jgi:hypothetical protein
MGLREVLDSIMTHDQNIGNREYFEGNNSNRIWKMNRNQINLKKLCL